MLAVVACNRPYAEATIKWQGLDEDLAAPLVYGDPVTTNFKAALLVRPLEGMTPGQREWLISELMPRVETRMIPHPQNWNPAAELPDPTPERIGTELEENPLFA